MRFYKFTGIFAIVLLLILASCSEDSSNEPVNNKPAAKIFVFSDPHLLAPSLMTSGDPDEAYSEQGRKLIQESDAIMEAIVSQIIASDAEIVLVPGDLTKDGTKASMEKFASYLEQLSANGIKVYVVPGNHDINNPQSNDYSSGAAVLSQNVSPAQFMQIFADMGYSDAIATDPHSLSYAAEPIDGLLIIGMDACRYDDNENRPYSDVGATFKAETQQWIEDQIREAASEGKTVIGMMHHGLVEHFSGQKLNPISSEYVVDNWQNVADNFADLGMKLVFTGHFHANDIVKRTSAEGFIFDIETGSTITHPCPYRILTLTADEKLVITTDYVESINFDTGGLPFREYSENYLLTGIDELAQNELLREEFGFTEEQIEKLTPIAASAIIAHYAGDEVMPADALEAINEMQNSGDQLQVLLAAVLKSIYTDLPPADNNITIDLKTGNVIQ